MNLEKSTIQTFFMIIEDMGITDNIKYNSQKHILAFGNGSQIFLIDLFPLPQDPNYTRLGGHEYTFVIIDEAAEVSLKAYQILKTRIRYKLKENNLIGKMLICSNPSKGWLYDIFYSPWRNGELPPHRKFIQALPSDNTYADENVLKMYTIEELGTTFYNLLVLGDWDYDSSALDIFNFDAVQQCFYNYGVGGIKYITCDPAGQGNDNCVITVWQGYQCQEIYTYPKTTIPQIIDYIKQLMASKTVNISNVCIDGGGLGIGVTDSLPGCQKFIANSKALKNEIIYASLKDQLYFKFAEMVREGKIGITSDPLQQNEIVRELEAHKMYNVDRGRTQVTPKSMVKQLIGKSPDLADALMMRAYFEYKNTGGIEFGW
jgi:hypothetical protein